MHACFPRDVIQFHDRESGSEKGHPRALRGRVPARVRRFSFQARRVKFEIFLPETGERTFGRSVHLEATEKKSLDFSSDRGEARTVSEWKFSILRRRRGKL